MLHVILLFLFLLATVLKGGAQPLSETELYRNNWAILIGINKYRNAPPLNYAVADVMAIKELLIAKFGFQPERIFSLTDEKATRDNILKLFGELDKTGEEDRIIIFFSGHGTQIELPNGGEMGFLIPVDGKANSKGDLFASSIPMQSLRELANYIPAKHILFLVDACYGGLAAVTNRSLAKDTTQYLKKITSAKARQILTAGGKGEPVIERSEWGHSAFTYKLLEGLGKGLADLDGDNIITATELSSWLRPNVAAATGNRQLPQFKAFTEDEGDFVFLLSTRPVQQFSSSNTQVTSAPQVFPQSPSQNSVQSQSQLPTPRQLTPAVTEEVKQDRQIWGKHLIRFQIIRATNIPPRKPDGSSWRLLGYPSSPRVSIWVKDEERKWTRVIRGQNGAIVTEVEWNEPLDIVLDPTYDEVTFKVMNRHDRFLIIQTMGDDEMGSVTLPRRTLKTGIQEIRLDTGIILRIDVSIIKKLGPEG